MKHFLPVILTFFCPFFAFSQDITGLWKGTMINDSTHDILQYEIIINKDNGKYSGLSHTWFLINDKKYYGIKKVKVRIAKDGKVVIQDAELIDNNYPIAPNKNVRQLNVLDLSGDGDGSVLDGVFVTNQTTHYKELSGHINVKKVSTSGDSDLLQYLKKRDGESSLTISK